jgi:hypothetical protein
LSDHRGVADFQYFRVYSDEHGESHVEDVSVPLREIDFAPPAAPLNLAALGAAAEVSVLRGSADWQGSQFHPAPARQLMCILAGHGSITASDGETRSGGPGMTFLLEDTSGRGHSSRFFEEVTVLVVRMPEGGDA